MLVKFCKPEHNLSLGCNTIRFGTLEYYRKLDPSFLIADENEGVDEHEVNHIGEIPSDKECVEFLTSTGFFSPDMYIQGITFRRTFPNCYIWCCKQMDVEPKKEDGNQFNTDYSSSYKISEPNEFSQHLTNLLAHNIKRKHFSDSAHKALDEMPILELNSLNLMCYHGPVVYVEKKQGRLSFGRFESYAKQIPMALRQFFVKTNKYAPDTEYRFAFLFHHQQSGIVLPVNEEPIDIRFTPISA